MKQSFRRIWLLILLASGLVAGGLYIRNPFYWGVEKSSKFSEAEFARISTGQSIDEVIAGLGTPIRVNRSVRVWNLCLKCDVYEFAGNPARWVVWYKNAWVYVGPDGRVLDKVLYVEP